MRGKVKQLILRVEYPDGTTKETNIGDGAIDISAIYLDDEKVPSRAKAQWTMSETDWKQNPTVAVELRNGDILMHCSMIQNCPDDE